MKPGRILHTRDGRRIGNAVITSVEQHAKLGPVAHIRTDFGNTARFTQEELDGAFHFGNIQSLEQRAIDQKRLLGF